MRALRRLRTMNFETLVGNEPKSEGLCDTLTARAIIAAIDLGSVRDTSSASSRKTGNKYCIKSYAIPLARIIIIIIYRSIHARVLHGNVYYKKHRRSFYIERLLFFSRFTISRFNIFNAKRAVTQVQHVTFYMCA